MNSLKLVSFITLLLLLCSACTPRPRIRGGFSNPQAIDKNTPAPTLSTFAPIKKRAVVLDFYNESPLGGEILEKVASDAIRSSIRQSSDFILDIPSEKIFGTSKDIYIGAGEKLATMSKKAKLLGINLVVYGRIKYANLRQKTDDVGIVRSVKSIAEARLDVNIFDVSNNREIFSSEYSSIIDDNAYKLYVKDPADNATYRENALKIAVSKAVEKSIPEIMKIAIKLEWAGRVAKIIGSKIYINAGRRSGIQIGDLLKVMTEEKEIYDPETGALIGMSKGDIKGTLEVIDYFSEDGAITILHSGGAVTEGDFVQLY